jgi:zinc D-Ala-D-Ala carboxypeptidase
MSKLSKHFDLPQLTKSTTAIRLGLENNPNEIEQENLKWLCEKLLEPIHHNKGLLKITSGFRHSLINKAVGGSATSQHCHGQACDFTVQGMTVEELFLWIKGTDLPYDQLIQEFGSWVHISYNRRGNRKQALRATKQNGRTVYTNA